MKYIRSFFSTSGLFNILCWVAFLTIGLISKRNGVVIISFIFLVMAITRRKMFRRRAILPDSFWTEFVAKYPEQRETPHQIWRVINRPVDESNIVDRIDKGEVSGEAFSIDYFEYYNQPLPEVGAINIICDNGNNPYFIVETTDIIQTTFGAVTTELARIEGFNSASIWKTGNEDKFASLCNKADVEFNNDTRIFFEKFKIIYRPEIKERQKRFFNKKI